MYVLGLNVELFLLVWNCLMRPKFLVNNISWHDRASTVFPIHESPLSSFFVTLLLVTCVFFALQALPHLLLLLVRI